MKESGFAWLKIKRALVGGKRRRHADLQITTVPYM